jgi:hypothetical protein
MERKKQDYLEVVYTKSAKPLPHTRTTWRASSWAATALRPA